jgi:tape measure domain-containing protein
MEQNRVAFSQFLGSSRAAGRELKFLYKTAAATPFEVPQITTAARRLLAFGFNAKQANSWLSTIGDTIAGMGGGAQEIDQLVTAIGQIRSKGQLQGDELMQLSELGVVNRAKLAKDLGISTLELMSGRANISGQRALRALQKQFDNTFGGQAAKQARTFNGQLSTLHDNLNQTLGTITKPGFTVLENRVLPALGKTTDEINKTFGRKDLDLSQKIKISEADAKPQPRTRSSPPARAEFRKSARRPGPRCQRSSSWPSRGSPTPPGTQRRASPGRSCVAGCTPAPGASCSPPVCCSSGRGAFSARGQPRRPRCSSGATSPTVVAGEAAAAAGASGAGGAAGALGLLGRAGPLGLAFAGAAAGGGLLGHWLGERANDRDARHRHQANIRRFRARGEIPVTLPDGTTYWESRANARVDPNYHPRARARSPRARGAHIEHIHLHMDGREVTHVVRRVVRDEQARR